jgi:hypothetical protein
MDCMAIRAKEGPLIYVHVRRDHRRESLNL